MVYSFCMMHNGRGRNTTRSTTPWSSRHVFVRCYDIPRVFVAGDQSITALTPAQGFPYEAVVLGLGKDGNDYEAEEV